MVKWKSALSQRLKRNARDADLENAIRLLGYTGQI
jgi:hypothetical protein